MSAEIIQAVRNFNAARKAYERAIARFREVCPPDVMVLHCLPGEEDKPDTLWWSYSNFDGEGPGRGLFNPERAEHLKRYRVVRMVAPAPNDEVAASSRRFADWLDERIERARQVEVGHPEDKFGRGFTQGWLDALVDARKMLISSESET